jgi:hypothetical protein
LQWVASIVWWRRKSSRIKCVKSTLPRYFRRILLSWFILVFFINAIAGILLASAVTMSGWCCCLTSPRRLQGTGIRDLPKGFRCHQSWAYIRLICLWKTRWLSHCCLFQPLLLARALAHHACPVKCSLQMEAVCCFCCAYGSSDDVLLALLLQ